MRNRSRLRNPSTDVPTDWRNAAAPPFIREGGTYYDTSLHKIGRTVPNVEGRTEHLSDRDLYDMADEMGMMRYPSSGLGTRLAIIWRNLSRSQRLDYMATHILKQDRAALHRELLDATGGSNALHSKREREEYARAIDEMRHGILSASQYWEREQHEVLMAEFPTPLQYTPSRRPQWVWNDGYWYGDAARLEEME